MNAITRISKNGNGEAFAVFLSDGQKITIGREKGIKGRVWLEIGRQAKIELMSKPVDRIDFVERQMFRQEPDCYAGDSCDKVRPRWMTSYPKEGDEEDGETLKLEIPANTMPPGSRVTIEVPCCPKCGDPSDFSEPDPARADYPAWPACKCGFSWS